MRKFDLSLRSSRSSYFATFRHQLTILSKTDALDEEKWLRSEERFSRNAETDLVCRLLLEKKKKGDPQASGRRGRLTRAGAQRVGTAGCGDRAPAFPLSQGRVGLR